MGICYSQQQQWEAYSQTRRQRRRKPKNRHSSVIYQQKSIYQSSFSSHVYASFRDDLHNTISDLANEGSSLLMGSIVEMKEQQLAVLHKSLHKINPEGQPHDLNKPFLLCNLKTKNYLHTHKIKIPDNRYLNEVSCCPYNSNHIPEYDIWKIVQVDVGGPSQSLNPQELINGDQIIWAFIYHPFSQRFLSCNQGRVGASQDKKVWQIRSYGPLRNGGFLKISCEEGELCMSDCQGLLQKHRRLEICKQQHVSHIWQLMFVEPDQM